MHAFQEVSSQKVLDTMYIVSLIKLSLREGNIAIQVSINITVSSNMFSVFSKGIKLHCVIGIHDNGLDRTYILMGGGGGGSNNRFSYGQFYACCAIQMALQRCDLPIP